MFLDQILNRIYHIFLVFKYFLCVLGIFLGWTQRDPNWTRSVTKPNPNQQTLITLLGPTILDLARPGSEKTRTREVRPREDRNREFQIILSGPKLLDPKDLDPQRPDPNPTRRPECPGLGWSVLLLFLIILFALYTQWNYHYFFNNSIYFDNI